MTPTPTPPKMTLDDAEFLAECARDFEKDAAYHEPESIEDERDEAEADISMHYWKRAVSLRNIESLVRSLVSGERRIADTQRLMRVAGRLQNPNIPLEQRAQFAYDEINELAHRGWLGEAK